MITTDDAINEVLREIEIARNQFAYCDNDLMDSAIYRLNSAEAKLNALITRRRVEK